MLDLEPLRLTDREWKDAVSHVRRIGGTWKETAIAEAQFEKLLFGVLHWLEHDLNPAEWDYSISQGHSTPSLYDGGRRYAGRALREATTLAGISEKESVDARHRIIEAD